MASITYWNRLEPRPVAPSIAETLAARLRDPLWLLTRQWQFGEFQGEDAGSPAYVHIHAVGMPLTAWRPGAGAWRPLDNSGPIEAIAEGEAISGDDLSLQVELAEAFERLLRARADIDGPGADAVMKELVAKLPLAAPPAADAMATRFYRVCAPRSFNGVTLFTASRQNPPVLPPGVAIDPASAAAVTGAQKTFAAWVSDAFGNIGSADPEAWQPDRLEYEFSIATRTNSGDRFDFDARPELDGAIDWHELDVGSIDKKQQPPAADAQVIDRTVMPIHVRFRGMPNARWWDFEDSQTDFGDLRLDRRDVGRLVVTDFMLVQGNDWFVVPLELPVGSVCRVDELSVRDVFGGLTWVPRADTSASDSYDKWTLFTSAVIDAPTTVAPLLVLPPSVSAAIQVGDPIEDVRFFRDEMANLVWAVERVVPGGAGGAWAGQERSTAMAPAGSPAAAGLFYQIQTPVPRNWIPFLAVTIDPARGDIALERAAMLDSSVAPPVPIPPVGRVLRPHGGVDPYRVREEEVSRSGVNVCRVYCRSRWIDGSTWLWTMRQRQAGAGEGASGLQFDRA